MLRPGTRLGRMRRLGEEMSTTTTIRKGALEASIDSQGAQLMSLKLSGNEYLWQGDEKFWPRRAPILFPIVGCLRNNFAKSAAGEVHLGRHGLARNYEHRIVEKTEDSVTFELESTPETMSAFPYAFRLNMTYTVDGERMLQRFTVTNTGDEIMPFTLGGHPAFNVPAPDANGESFDDYELRFTRPWTAVSPAIDADGLCDFDRPFTLFEDADTLSLSHELFDKYLTLTFQDVPGRTVTLLGTKSGHGVELDFDDFPYLGVWSAPGAPFVAIEPWRGVATCHDESDIFEEKRGMESLDLGEKVSYEFSVSPF